MLRIDASVTVVTDGLGQSLCPYITSPSVRWSRRHGWSRWSNRLRASHRLVAGLAAAKTLTKLPPACVGHREVRAYGSSALSPLFTPVHSKPTLLAHSPLSSCEARAALTRMRHPEQDAAIVGHEGQEARRKPGSEATGSTEFQALMSLAGMKALTARKVWMFQRLVQSAHGSRLVLFLLGPIASGPVLRLLSYFTQRVRTRRAPRPEEVGCSSKVPHWGESSSLETWLNS